MFDSSSNMLGGTVMKSTICLVMGAAWFGALCLAQTSSGAGNDVPAQVHPAYTITLAEPTGPLSLGSEIKVPMTVTNVTGGDILWRAVRSADSSAWHRGFRFLLTNNGKEVETTVFHRKIAGRQRQGDPNEVDRGSTILLSKAPGIMFVILVDLRRLYEIKEPGKYKLQISRVAEDDKTIVSSNTVTLTIVP
jgi:hypothetical protein